MKRNLALIIAALVLVAALIVCIIFSRSGGNQPETSLAELSDEQTTSMPASDDGTTTEPSTEEPISIDNVVTSESTEPTETEPPTTQLTSSLNPETGRIVVDVDREDWNLIVVNAGREMPEGYVPELKQILSTGIYMDYRVTPHYEDMYNAAKKEGLNLTPYSGYRSYDRQKRNYENLTNSYMSQYKLSKEDAAKKAATVILPPGTSEHNLGFAMDIQGTESSFAQTKEYAWLTEHAHEYGFILRYTAEKQPITGIIPEPWHWRYVGVEYAKKIRDSGLCLEEYLDSIGVAY